jgi:hypothetical protein
MLMRLQSTDLLTDNPTVRAPTAMPPLLQRLTERKPETLDYLGVSYGLTPPLLRCEAWPLDTLFGTNEELLVTDSGNAQATFHFTSDKRRASSQASTRALWFVD